VENAWHLLHHCRNQPGTRPNGEIDAAACTRFVDEVLALCRRQGRSVMGEQTIGQLFAHAQVGEDGIWPGPPARDILNRPERKQMRAGFEGGTRNKQGVTTRAMDEGGDQERALAVDFRYHADALSATHPLLSAGLEQIATS
jgi:hypothetical protein